MNNMFSKFLFFFLFFIGVVRYSTSKAQSIDLIETKGNTVQKKFKNILIIGAGSKATRLFLDNLTTDLISELTKKEINAVYHYDGNLDRNTQIDFKSFVSEKFDGYIVFNISDTSFANRKNKSLNVGIPITGGRNIVPININYSRLKYSDIFLIEFFEYPNSLSSIWEGILKLNFDFSKEKFYPRINDILIKNFEKNKLL